MMTLDQLRDAFRAEPKLSTAAAYFNKAMDLWVGPSEITDAEALAVNAEVAKWARTNGHNLERLGVLDRAPASIDQQFTETFP